MSVLREAYAVPSRVIGAYRYLLQARGQREIRETLESVLAPESLRNLLQARGQREIREAPESMLAPESARKAGGDDDRERGGLKMAQATVRECIAMGLFAVEGDDVRIHPTLAGSDRDGSARPLPLLLSDLFFSPEREENHDLGLVIAWYLTLNTDDAPGNWKTIDQELREKVGGDRFGVTNTTPYGMFEDWACYLGFAWKHADKAGGDAMTPDPTAQVRWRLPGLFQGRTGERQGLQDLTARLATLCPVLEGGSLRRRVEQQVRGAETGSLSSATARAWLRLEEEGAVELVRESDAPGLILPDGEDRRFVTHVVWLRAN